jgi:hypothetical protein
MPVAGCGVQRCPISISEPAFYNIFVINGSTVGARRVSDGREIHRDASKFKLASVAGCGVERYHIIISCMAVALSIIIYSLILYAVSRLLVFWSS